MKTIIKNSGLVPFSLLLLVVSLASGCATSRGVLDIRSDSGVSPQS